MNSTYNRLMDELKELHDTKANDYAEEGNPYSNFEFAAQIAKQFTNPIDQVFATLIGIKLARLGQLQRKKPNYESVQDTMRDLTNYAAIWTARTIEWTNLTMKSDKLFEEYKDRLSMEDREETIAKTFVSHLQTQQG